MKLGIPKRARQDSRLCDTGLRTTHNKQRLPQILRKITSSDGNERYFYAATELQGTNRLQVGQEVCACLCMGRKASAFPDFPGNQLPSTSARKKTGSGRSLVLRPLDAL